MLLLALLGGSGAWGAGQQPLRLVALHPYPRLCEGQEQGQQERRLLRLAYWVARPGARNRLPPFYRLTSTAPGQSAPARLTLATEALWGVASAVLEAGHPDFPGGPLGAGLAPWHAAMVAAVPGLADGAPPSLLSFAVDGAQAGPYFLSRLEETGLLPALTGYTPGSDVPCRHWPAGVTYRPEAGRLRYVLARDPGGVGPAFTLHAYRTLRPLIADLRRGAADAMLLEGDGFEAATAPVRRLAGGRVADYPGTQQVLLRLAPRLRAALGAEGIMLLSLSLSRTALAEAAGPGFAPARAFLEPLLPATPEDAGVLRWNSLQARREWLKKERPAVPLRLGVLEHPLLLRVAHGISGQLKRTLNLTVTVHPLPVDRFRLAEQRGEVELTLDVADLDDGSLQEMWRAALTRPGGPSGAEGSAGGLAEDEARLQAALPYLPLLGNLHYLLTPGPAAFRRVAVLCPTCRPRPYAAYLHAH